MNDQQIMEDILMTTKGVCDLYMHGTIESATPRTVASSFAHIANEPSRSRRSLRFFGSSPSPNALSASAIAAETAASSFAPQTAFARRSR